MQRHAPQGLEGEDRVALGLTANRLAYLVLACLAAYSVLHMALPAAVRYVVATVLAVAGAVLAWGRFRGRGLDRWLILAALFYTRPRRGPAPTRQANSVRAQRAPPGVVARPNASHQRNSWLRLRAR